jgi:hypothetical protein
MANTWGYVTQGVAYALNKSMIEMGHSSSDTRYERIREIVMLNNSLSAVTGVILQEEIRRTTARSAGTTLTAVSRDSSNAALNANLSGRTGGTITDGSLYRRFVWVNEEPVVGGAAMANWLTLVPFGLVWPPSVGDSALQPLTLVASTDEGFHVKNITSSTVGGVDLEMWFTDEAS